MPLFPGLRQKLGGWEGAENKAAKCVFPEKQGSGKNSPDSCALWLGELRAFTCFIQRLCLVWVLEIYRSILGSSVMEVVPMISLSFAIACSERKSSRNRGST